MKTTAKTFCFRLGALLFSSTFAYADTLFVSNYGNNTIEEFAPNGTSSLFANSGLNAPMGLAFDNSGNLYVANYGTGGSATIEKFAPNGMGSVFASTGSPGMNNPTGLAFDSSGNLYAALCPNSGTLGSDIGTITKFAPNGTGSVFVNSSLDFPFGLAFDSSGNLYAANYGNYGNNTIMKFTPNGTGSLFASISGGVGLVNPVGVAFDSSGNLYVACSGNNTIMKFTPNGMGSVFASTGLDFPKSVF